MIVWQATRLGDICKTNQSTYSPKENWQFVNYLDTGSITMNKINQIQEINTCKDKLPSRARRKVQINSIIYSTVRPNQNHYGIIKEQPDNFLVSTGFTVIDVDSDKAIPDYVYYILTKKEITEQLQAIAEQSVSAYPSIKSSDLENLELILPDISTQKKIVSILDSIDKKINSNNAINNNLEQQARALYKSWFIDFEPFGGVMPIDWRTGQLKDILKLKRNSIKAGQNTELPYLPIDVIPMKTFAISEFKLNEEAKSSLVTFSKNDIIIGAMRVYFHRVVLAPCDGITRTTCFTLVPHNPEYLSYCLLCCDLDSSIEYAQTTSKGSTMPYAIWDGGLGDMEISIPSLKVAKEFNDVILPMLEKIQSSYYENTYLKELRDSLLSKLMSGDIDVSRVEI